MDSTESMEAFAAYHRGMVKFTAIVCVAVAIGLAVFLPGDWSWAGGFVIGAAVQLLKFGLLDMAVVKKIALERDAAATTQVKAMFITLALFAVAVLVTYKLQLNVWAFAAGIFLPRIILVADTYVRPNLFAKGKQEREEGEG